MAEEMQLTNHQGSTLRVSEDYISLTHQGASAVLLGLPRGTKTLTYDDFTSVEFKPMKLMSVGYIQFNVPGHRKNPSKNEAMDEYAFMFNKKIQAQAEAMYKKILEYKKAAKTNSGGTTVIHQASAADELLKFKSLLDAGVITQEEFDRKKKELLGL